MSNPMIRIHDIETGEIIDREMTIEEKEIFDKKVLESKKNTETLKQMEKSRSSALAKLAALGLTEDEIAAL